MIRAIEHAYCTDTNEKFSLSENTDSQKERFEIRENVQVKKREFTCIECGQKLTVAVSAKDLLYFRHLPKSNDCVLKNATKDEIKSFNEFYAAKESPRHKFLKNEIGKKLKSVNGVSSVHIDDKFIIKNGQKRRPDVYCKFEDYELAFEIQLSDLSLSYLSSRHEFYRKNGIFLIWILDNFNPEKSTQLVRDIKYLNTYQNFFKLNENEEDFILTCKYKKSYIDSFFKVGDKWTVQSVKLDELNFNKVENEVYFLDYGTIRKNLEAEAERKIKEEEIKREKERKERALKDAKIKIEIIINEIRDTKNRKFADYSNIERKISSLSEFEVEVLNNNLNYSEKPIIAEWFKKANNVSSNYFISFFLRCKEVKLDVNLPFEEDSPFKLLIQNSSLNRDSLIKELLKRGYNLTENDKAVYISEFDNDDFLLYESAEKLDFDSEIDMLFIDKIRKLFFIIESMKQKRILNSRLPNWVAFGNNLIEHYNDYWDYLEKGLKHFGIWNKIVEMDKKSTFQNKVSILKFDLPQQKTDFIDLFKKIFPELK